MKVLVSQEEYRIVLHQAGDVPSEKIVITFSGLPHTLDDKGFGTDYCLAHGWDNIYVSQLRGTQFQGLSREAFVAAVTPELEGKDVICYGSSLGGYAAFYYGGSLDARIIAAAPVFPALLDNWANKPNALEVVHDNLADVPRSSQPPFVIYDPLQVLDKRFVDRAILPVYRETLRLEEYPLGGHMVLDTLKRTNQMSFITRLIECDEMPNLKPLQPGDVEYHLQYGRLLRGQDQDKAIEELEKAQAILPSNRIMVNLLPALIKRGDIDRAQEIINQAQEACDNDQRIVGRFRDELIDAGLDVAPEAEMKERIRAKQINERRAAAEAARRAKTEAAESAEEVAPRHIEGESRHNAAGGSNHSG